MNFRLLAGCAALGLAGTLGLTLAGCGGGSSAAVTTPARAPALIGAVQAPQSQTRGISRVPTTNDPLVPVTGATVTLVNIDDSTTANGLSGNNHNGRRRLLFFPNGGTRHELQSSGGKDHRRENADADRDCHSAGGPGSGSAYACRHPARPEPELDGRGSCSYRSGGGASGG